MSARKETTIHGVTVVEFTLLPEHAQALGDALTPAVLRGSPLPDKQLEPLVRSHLPTDMLGELSSLPARGNDAVVYVIHGLPELPQQAFRNHYAVPSAGGRPDAPTLADPIARGVLLHMEHKSTQNNPMQLRKSQRGKYAMHPHKDGFMVSAFSSVINDQQAPTRFTNWAALLADATSNPVLSGLKIKYGAEDNISLGEFSARFSGWQEKLAGTIQLSRNNPPTARGLWDALMEKHSRDIILERGGTALWTNDGVIVHNAMNGTIACKEGEISRATVLNLAQPLNTR